jgi:hypothetical protein
MINCPECERLKHEWAATITAVEHAKAQPQPDVIEIAVLDIAQWDALVALGEHCEIHRPVKLFRGLREATVDA